MLIGSAIVIGRRIKHREDSRVGLWAGLRLTAMELRRSLGWLALPVLVALAAQGVWEGLRRPGMLWAETSYDMHFLVFFAGPLVGGVAAWVATRERRRKAEDLLATTSRPELSRRLATLTATALAGALSYALVCGGVFAVTVVHATWGGPALWPLTVGFAALISQSALGYAAGSRLQSRFTAPLAAVGLFAAQWFMVSGPYGNWSSSWQSYLSPGTQYQYSAWFGLQPVDVMPGQVLFLIGLGVVGAGGLAFGRARAPHASGVLALGLAAAVSGAFAVYQAELERVFYYDEPLLGYEALPHEMSCAGNEIPICVHPAYESVLPSLADDIEPMTGPIAGLPGAPDRVEQVAAGAAGFSPESPSPGTAGFLLDELTYNRTAINGVIDARITAAAGLVHSPEGTTLDSYYGPGSVENPAREAVAIWLLRQTGTDLCEGSADTRVCEAADRFFELERDERREWLRENYGDLRAGELRLRDMP